MKKILFLFLSLFLAVSFSFSQTELVANGDFETGDLTGWSSISSGGSTGFLINDGTLDPVGPQGILPPINGSYDAISTHNLDGPGLNLLSNPIAVPSFIVSATLSWTDIVNNWGGSYVDPTQEFRVSILHGADPPIEVFSTNPGDPLHFGPTSRTFDLTAVLQGLAGELIQLEIAEQANQYHLNVSIDDVSLLVNGFSCSDFEHDITLELDENGQTSLDPVVLPLGIDKQKLLISSGDNLSGEEGFTDFTIPITQDVVVKFNWDYSTIDWGPGYDPFGYLIDNSFTQLSDNTGGNLQSGSHTVELSAGEVFGFRAWTIDNVVGPSVTIVLDFEPGYYGMFDCPNWTHTNTNSDGIAQFLPGVIAWYSQTEFDCGDVTEVQNIDLNFKYGCDGDILACPVTVTVEDNIDPVITCPEVLAGYDTDEGLCTASLSFLATATDNCSATIEYFVDGGLITFPYDFPFGITTVTAVATDIGGNTDECSFDVNVDNIITTTSVTVTPSSAQYSDLVTFQAIVIPWMCPDAGTAAVSVNFYVEDQLMGNAPLINGVATLEDVALLEPDFTEDCFTDGVMAPGDKTVTAEFLDINPNFTIVDPTTDLTITQEDISVEYTGTSITGTTKVGSSQAYEAMLRAVVWDDTDDNTGDVRNAKVRFLEGGSPISDWVCINLLDESDPTQGMAEFLWSGTINDDVEHFDISIEVGGYYVGTSIIYPLLVYVPGGEFITGGGHMILTDDVAGMYAATPGTKMNFGYNVKWNKRGTNLQGKMNIIYRVGFGPDKQVFQIKSNATHSLGIDNVEGSGAWAEFTAKANLTDVTDPENPISMGGNFTLHVTTTDNGEPGKEDEISITLYDGEPSALIFCSNWVFPNAVEQVIDGGNLVVYHESDGGGGGGNGKGKGKSGTINIDTNNIAGLNIYPNPFSDRTFFEITAATDSHAKLDIYNVNGQKIATLIDQSVNAGEEYRLEYNPGTIANGILFYTLTIDNEVKTGKLIHRR